MLLFSGTQGFAKSFPVVILIPCKLDTIERSMHILRYFSKGVLDIWFSSIHSCPWLHLYPVVACCYLAPKLLNNVAVSLLTLSSVVAMIIASVPCTLWTCSCHAQLHKHVFLLLVALPCHVLLCSELHKLIYMPS